MRSGCEFTRADVVTTTLVTEAPNTITSINLHVRTEAMDMEAFALVRVLQVLLPAVHSIARNCPTFSKPSFS